MYPSDRRRSSLNKLILYRQRLNSISSNLKYGNNTNKLPTSNLKKVVVLTILCVLIFLLSSLFWFTLYPGILKMSKISADQQLANYKKLLDSLYQNIRRSEVTFCFLNSVAKRRLFFKPRRTAPCRAHRGGAAKTANRRIITQFLLSCKDFE